MLSSSNCSGRDCIQIFLSNKFFVMFCGLHLEQVSLTLIGDVLKNSAWSQVLVRADIFNSGVADYLLAASHYKKTRRAHEITFPWHYVQDKHLMKKGFNNSKTMVQNNFRPLCVQDFWELKNLERLLTNQPYICLVNHETRRTHNLCLKTTHRFFKKCLCPAMFVDMTHCNSSSSTKQLHIQLHCVPKAL